MLLIQQNLSSGNSYSITASSGSYTYTGSSVTVSKDRNLTTSSGSYSYTGSSVAITKTSTATSYSITASSGSYSYSGSSIIILRDKLISASSGSYSYSGNTVDITYAASYGDYPDPAYVLIGIVYGPGGMYTGTYDGVTKKLKYDINSGKLIKIINDKLGMTL